MCTVYTVLLMAIYSWKTSCSFINHISHKGLVYFISNVQLISSSTVKSLQITSWSWKYFKEMRQTYFIWKRSFQLSVAYWIAEKSSNAKQNKIFQNKTLKNEQQFYFFMSHTHPEKLLDWNIPQLILAFLFGDLDTYLDIQMKVLLTNKF